MMIERMIELLEAEHACMLRKAHDDCSHHCECCDLVQDDGELHEMYTDVIALLKAQEPKVMTLEEARAALHNDPVVWVELRDQMLCGGIHMDGSRDFTMQNGDALDEIDLDNEDAARVYGKRVRCWTHKPTDEQRYAASWETE